MNMDDAVVPISDILTTRSKFHILLTYLTQKTGQIDYDDLIEESVDTFVDEYKDEKVTKQSIYQLIKKFKDDKIISIEKHKNTKVVKLLVKAPYRMFNVDKSFSVKTINIALILSVFFFFITLAFTLAHTQIHIFWWIFFLFCNVFLFIVIRVDHERHFSLAKKPAK